jgi:hypothetical protein
LIDLAHVGETLAHAPSSFVGLSVVLVDGEWTPVCIADGAVRDEAAEELVELNRHLPTPRDAVAYDMDTLLIVRRRDEEKYVRDYRTKRLVLDTYDDMLDAVRTGQTYQTRLDPPPADPRCCRSPRDGEASVPGAQPVD